MSLSAGEKLGPSEVQASIGAGGMGEVYRARDPRLGRDVAIKVSAERFSERFEREATAIAALNHSNVCHLYDGGPNYLVMELVDGPTLEERIKQGAISLDEALAIAYMSPEQAKGKPVDQRADIYAFGAEMTFINGGYPMVSPNGKWVVLPATGSDGVTRMWLRALDSVEVRPLADTEAPFTVVTNWQAALKK